MTLLLGVSRSKRMALTWLRKSADCGKFKACTELAQYMYEAGAYTRPLFSST